MILKTVSRYSGVICSTVSILRIPRSSPQFTVREIKGLSLVLKGFFGVLVPSAIDGTLSDSQLVQELVCEPLVVDDLPHGGQGLFDIGARPRRQVVALQQPLEGSEGPAARAALGGDAPHQVAGAIADDREAAEAEGCGDALATLTKRDRLVRGGIDDLLDEVVLGDVDAAAAGGALEPGNTGGLGHAREVARARTPLLLDEPLGGRDGCAGLTGV